MGLYKIYQIFNKNKTKYQDKYIYKKNSIIQIIVQKSLFWFQYAIRGRKKALPEAFIISREFLAQWIFYGKKKNRGFNRPPRLKDAKNLRLA